MTEFNIDIFTAYSSKNSVSSYDLITHHQLIDHPYNFSLLQALVKTEKNNKRLYETARGSWLQSLRDLLFAFQKPYVRFRNHGYSIRRCTQNLQRRLLSIRCNSYPYAIYSKARTYQYRFHQGFLHGR